MAIIETITDMTRLYHDLQQTRDYRNRLSYNGAKALMEYMDELSGDIDIEYDPIALCCEYTEYPSAICVCKQYFYSEVPPEDESTATEWLRDNTAVIAFDGGVIVQNF